MKEEANEAKNERYIIATQLGELEQRWEGEIQGAEPEQEPGCRPQMIDKRQYENNKPNYSSISIKKKAEL